MNTKVQGYVEALLQNPEWLKNVALKHGVLDTQTGHIVRSLTAQQIANEIFALEYQIYLKESARG
jgi:hypothetical protein